MDDSLKKLNNAEKKVKELMFQIRRKNAALKNWERRVSYYQKKVQIERAVSKKEAQRISATLSGPEGRKFREV